MRVPSPAEKAEVERVRDMQVRRDAAGMATTLLAQRQTSQSVWGKWVRYIEAYILTGELSGDPVAPVQPPG
jgi:hypothetical protein